MSTAATGSAAALDATANTVDDAPGDKTEAEKNAERDDAAFRKHQLKAANEAVKRAKEHLAAAQKTLASVKKDN